VGWVVIRAYREFEVKHLDAVVESDHLGHLSLPARGVEIEKTLIFADSPKGGENKGCGGGGVCYFAGPFRSDGPGLAGPERTERPQN
jgi:hypothetical protein